MRVPEVVDPRSGHSWRRVVFAVSRQPDRDRGLAILDGEIEVLDRSGAVGVHLPRPAEHDRSHRNDPLRHALIPALMLRRGCR
jgi:hypothetical protein